MFHDKLTGCEEHDDTDDTSRKQTDRVARQAQSLENSRCVVQNRVDTSPLLEEHGERRDGHTPKHAPRGEQTANSDELQLED